MVKSYQVAAVRKYLDEYKSIGKAKLMDVLMDGFNVKTMPKSITIPEPKLKKYFSSNYTIKDMEKIIYRLLEWVYSGILTSLSLSYSCIPSSSC